MREFTHAYDVQSATGYPSALNPSAQWNRGTLYRLQTPVFSIAPFWPMFDPSDPADYNQALSP